ncbi:hypothetical protein P152DRAFT_495423 [Eremomyces bilateralis CBS 781.70]|uniref:Arrestin C-terminal-like domain-containing protein n=1 Tax=Eremomyces bilateralis CBS 781.70 TaxID=1392243 RepID=A0A6G1GBV3_9PEZI|nr:uncharacterized protein P152DRAFT_495423 [Eremomyces bilateralis CBS 781.70]KAF1815319.1 hypothetical protein P152DRAFT_495423 [Eremomyces bilateralis CBS 781.70]
MASQTSPALEPLYEEYQYTNRSLNYPTMAGYLPVHAQRGRLYYLPSDLPRSQRLSDPDLPASNIPRLFTARSRRPQRIHVERVRLSTPSEPPSAKATPYLRKSTTTLIAEKFNLAVSKESAKRFLRSFIAPPSAPRPDDPPSHPSLNRLETTDIRRPDEQVAAPSGRRIGRSASSRGEGRRPDRAATSSSFRHSLAGPITGAPSAMSLTSTLIPAVTPDVRVLSPHRPPPTNPPATISTPDPRPTVLRTTKVESEEKPIASGNGVSVFISLTEPVLFLQGFEQSDSGGRGTAMLRGSLRVKVTKPSKLKGVTLRFKGKATTKWPEGIPPKKTEFEETDTIMSHTWPFFNAQFPTAELGPGADHFELFPNKLPLSSTSTPESSMTMHKSRASFDIRRISPPSTANGLSKSEQKRLSLQVNQSRSFSKDETPIKPGNSGSSVSQKGYRTFQPGEYFYNFELPLDSHLPETLSVDLGSVGYTLEAEIARAGAFRANLVGTKPVVLIRAPSEGSLEQVEPIAISRNWEDQLHYDIVISGKSFPLGAQVPIAFKLTPLAKVTCHRIKVYVTENVEYWAHNKRVHRMEPTRKIQLFEKRADARAVSTYPGSTMRILSGGGLNYEQRQRAAMGEPVQQGSDPVNLLGNLDGEASMAAGPTEMEFSVRLPTCRELNSPESRGNRLHFDTTYQNIQVHHWIKIVMRLSRPDKNDPSKRRHFEISIDSPFHILSCRAVQANLALPAYTSENFGALIEQPNLATCGCGGAAALSANHAPGWMAEASSRSNAVHQRDYPPPPASEPGLSNATLLDPSSATSSQPSSGRSTARNSAVLSGVPESPITLPRPEAAHMAGGTSTYTSTPTPPPHYESIANPTTGLADYFQRLSDAYAGESGSDDEAPAGRRNRVEVPLTPGGRSSRSMDGVRWWFGQQGQGQQGQGHGQQNDGEDVERRT